MDPTGRLFGASKARICRPERKRVLADCARYRKLARYKAALSKVRADSTWVGGCRYDYIIELNLVGTSSGEAGGSGYRDDPGRRRCLPSTLLRTTSCNLILIDMSLATVSRIETTHPEGTMADYLVSFANHLWHRQVLSGLCSYIYTCNKLPILQPCEARGSSILSLYEHAELVR